MRNERISKIKQDLNVKNQYIYDVVQRFKKRGGEQIKKRKKEKKIRRLLYNIKEERKWRRPGWRKGITLKKYAQFFKKTKCQEKNLEISCIQK